MSEIDYRCSSDSSLLYLKSTFCRLSLMTYRLARPGRSDLNQGNRFTHMATNRVSFYLISLERLWPAGLKSDTWLYIDSH